MLCYLIYVRNMKIHLITSYVSNSKFKLHRTGEFCRTYELQCTHCFFRAKTAKVTFFVVYLYTVIFMLSFYFVAIF